MDAVKDQLARPIRDRLDDLGYHAVIVMDEPLLRGSFDPESKVSAYIQASVSRATSILSGRPSKKISRTRRSGSYVGSLRPGESFRRCHVRLRQRTQRFRQDFSTSCSRARRSLITTRQRAASESYSAERRRRTNGASLVASLTTSWPRHPTAPTFTWSQVFSKPA